MGICGTLNREGNIDGNANEGKAAGALEGQMNRQYADRLARAKRHISYEEWLRLVEETGEEREYPYYPGILSRDRGRAKLQSGTEEEEPRSLAERCDSRQQQGFTLLREQGIWLVLQKDGHMDPDAFSWIADHFKEYSETQLLYGDEDALDVTGSIGAALISSRSGPRIPGCPASIRAV